MVFVVLFGKGHSVCTVSTDRFWSRWKEWDYKCSAVGVYRINKYRRVLASVSRKMTCAHADSLVLPRFRVHRAMTVAGLCHHGECVIRAKHSKSARVVGNPRSGGAQENSLSRGTLLVPAAVNPPFSPITRPYLSRIFGTPSRISSAQRRQLAQLTSVKYFISRPIKSKSHSKWKQRNPKRNTFSNEILFFISGNRPTLSTVSSDIRKYFYIPSRCIYLNVCAVTVKGK